MGVFLELVLSLGSAGSLPHARGGVSDILTRHLRPSASSPRPWGCFLQELEFKVRTFVFPTPVGVFPDRGYDPGRQPGLPHARGGVSRLWASAARRSRSSPRPWGCFPRVVSELEKAQVFPTPVGVFLLNGLVREHRIGLPHARGGVSLWNPSDSPPTGSSPRPWGCFLHRLYMYRLPAVFPTPVGVFPSRLAPVPGRSGLPHARGGVSAIITTHINPAQSSPRPWGCFRASHPCAADDRVFPTPVGVFPSADAATIAIASLPHARGGVSITTSTPPIRGRSSPRPWGCFLQERVALQVDDVFPTPVGVFLASLIADGTLCGLPHARGGVSLARRRYSVLNWSSPRPWGCFILNRAPVTKRDGLPHARGGVSGTANSAVFTLPSSPRPWGCFPPALRPVLHPSVFPTPVGVFLGSGF